MCLHCKVKQEQGCNVRLRLDQESILAKMCLVKLSQECGSLLAQVVLSVPSSAIRTVPCRDLAHRSWLLAPSPALLATKSPPCTKPGALRGSQWVRLSLPGQLHTPVCLEMWGSRSRAQPCPLSPCQPQAEAQNSPADSHSSAAQKSQRQGMCRSGRSCSSCRACLSFQGPETEADEESEVRFTLISLTQAGSALLSQHRSVPKHCSDPTKLEAPQFLMVSGSFSPCR